MKGGKRQGTLHSGMFDVVGRGIGRSKILHRGLRSHTVKSVQLQGDTSASPSGRRKEWSEIVGVKEWNEEVRVLIFTVGCYRLGVPDSYRRVRV